MKILWFTNTPSLAKIGGNTNTEIGGWISALQARLTEVNEIQLAVAFPNNKNEFNTFTQGNTRYFAYPTSDDNGILRGFIKRWGHKIESEDEIQYFFTIIDQFRPDLIHIFGSERQYGLITDQCRLPVILQVQGNLNACFSKWFSGISFYEVIRYCNKKNLILGYGIFHQFYLFKKRALREQRVLSQCKVVVGRTDWDKRIMKIFASQAKYYHCDELMRAEFYNYNWQLPGKSKILILSTLSPVIYKGLETVMNASALLMSTAGFSFEWLICGVKGTEEIVNIIEKSAGKKFKSVNVSFTGQMTGKELAKSLANVHCYVHPSHIENSPNSVCEAMLVGVPVIATYAGGTPSIVNDDEGILVQDGDPFALAGAIVELLSSPQQMLKLSQNARRKALTRHDPEKVIRQVLHIYKKILEAN